jgi:rubrerythrin
MADETNGAVGVNLTDLINTLNEKFEPKRKKEEDEELNECGACGATFKGIPKFCPECGVEF